MMRRALLLLSVLASTLIAIGQLPAQKEAGKLSILPSDVASLIGTWACKGGFRSGKPHESVYTAATILHGTWLEMTEHDSVPATGYDAEYLIGYDPEHKRLIEFDANNFGAASYSSSSGWQDRTLTMTSEPSDNPAAHYALNRFRYTVPSATAFDIDWEISQSAAAPDWITSDHLACTRSN